MKSNYAKISKWMIFASCILLTTYGIAQRHNFKIINLEEYDLAESYTVEETLQIIKPKGIGVTTLSTIDQMSMRPRKEVYHVLNTLDKKGEVITTIHHERPAHLEKWIQHPALTVINLDATTLYDANGKVLNKFDHDTKVKESKKAETDKVKKSGKFQDVDFSQLTGQQKAELAQNNGKLKKLSFFSEEIEYDSLIIRNIPEKLVKQFIHKNEKSKKGTSTAMKYTYSKDEDLYLEAMTMMDPKVFIFKNGTEEEGYEQICTNIKEYSFYKSTKYTKIKGRSYQGEFVTMQVISNLIYDNFLGITFETTEKSTKDETIKISIFDVHGKYVKEESVKDFFYGISIDISDLQNGVYFVNSSLTAGQSPVKFIKI